MKNMLKAGAATSLALHASLASAAINTGKANVDSELKGSEDSADGAVQVIIANAITFLYLIAVVFALWGGFNILTAGGDEEKVKKGKTILIQAAIGLVVIFLAASIVSFVIERLLGTT